MVDAKAINDMANIMRLLESSTPDETMLVTDDYAEPTGVAPPVLSSASVSAPEVSAMKTILERLQNIKPGSSEKIVEAARTDKSLAEAIVTEKTPRGVSIGKWEIVVNEGKSAKTYDVVDQTGIMIAKDLYLYDVAYTLAKRLNEGASITDARVGEVLKLEENYVKNLNDAGQYKQRAKTLRESGESLRANVAEDRFDDSQRNAMQAHNEILRLAGVRR